MYIILPPTHSYQTSYLPSMWSFVVFCFCGFLVEVVAVVVVGVVAGVVAGVLFSEIEKNT